MCPQILTRIFLFISIIPTFKILFFPSVQRYSGRGEFIVEVKNGTETKIHILYFIIFAVHKSIITTKNKKITQSNNMKKKNYQLCEIEES